MEMLKKLMASTAIVVAATGVMVAQKMEQSPARSAQTQIGGKWLEVKYGAPILRGRTDIFGGATYGAKVLQDGATIWRAGANKSTRLRTEAPIVIAGKTVPPGEYSVFIDLKPAAWTFVLSNWAAAENYPSPSKDQLWGSFDYTPAKDVVRAPMKLAKNTMSVDQLTWGFANVTAAGGDLVVMWEKEIASVPFTIAK